MLVDPRGRGVSADGGLAAADAELAVDTLAEIVDIIRIHLHHEQILLPRAGVSVDVNQVLEFAIEYELFLRVVLSVLKSELA